MNTIFILIDSLRRDYLGCYGNTWVQTPNLDALAENSTVLRVHISVPIPACPPEEISGQAASSFPGADGVRWNRKM